MPSNQDRIKGYAIVAPPTPTPQTSSINASTSTVYITSPKSVKVEATSFSMEGVFSEIGNEFLKEVIQPLVVAAGSGNQQFNHFEETPMSRALLCWSTPASIQESASDSSTSASSLDATNILRVTLDNIATANPNFTFCFGIFSAAASSNSSSPWKWNQWSRKQSRNNNSTNGNSPSSRNTTPPTSARGENNGYGNMAMALMMSNMAPDMITREFDHFRPFNVDGDSILGLFPLRNSTNCSSSSNNNNNNSPRHNNNNSNSSSGNSSRIAEPPRSYSTLTNVQEVLRQFNAVNSFCSSNSTRRQDAVCDVDQLVLVDVIGTTVSLANNDTAENNQEDDSSGNHNLFRFRFVHCLTSGAVRLLLPASDSRTNDIKNHNHNSNIASEIFGSNCKTSCVLLSPSISSFLSNQNNNNASSSSSSSPRSTPSSRNHLQDFATNDDNNVNNLQNLLNICRSDFQLLQFTRTIVNDNKNSSKMINILRANRFNPEALFSYLGVKLFHHHHHHHQASSASSRNQYVFLASQVQLSSSANNNNNNNNNNTNNNSPHVSAGNSRQAQTQIASSLSAMNSILNDHTFSDSSELVAKLRRELTALNDLVVELRSRALRSEELLREERTHGQHLQEEVEWLRNELTHTQQTQQEQAQLMLQNQQHYGFANNDNSNPQHLANDNGSNNNNNNKYRRENSSKVVASTSLPASNSANQHIQKQDQQQVHKSAAAAFVRSSTSHNAAGNSVATTTAESNPRRNSNVNKNNHNNVSSTSGRAASPLIKTPTSTSNNNNNNSNNISNASRRPQSVSVGSSHAGAKQQQQQHQSAATPRAVINALDRAVRKASPSISLSASQSPALSNTRRSEPPWVARRAVEKGHFASSSNGSKQQQQNANGGKSGRMSNNNNNDNNNQQQSLRVVTTLHRPKLVTATKESYHDEQTGEVFQRTRMVRHNEWEDPQEMMVRN